MHKTAFLFPGQGSQYSGMGRELANHYASARAVFDEADRVLGDDLSGICFDRRSRDNDRRLPEPGPQPRADEHRSGSERRDRWRPRLPETRLELTVNTQPAVLTVSVAAAAVLAERGIRPDYVAGHSLGEYSALVVAGAIRFADAVGLVRKRGKYMQEAVPPGVGAMAALLGFDAALIEGICSDAAQGQVISAANLNSPGQIVIAGNFEAVARAVEMAKARGAKRAILLNVSAPFHCALMQPAADRLAADLDALAIADPAPPLVNNVDSQLVTSADAVRDGLHRQVTAPVRWEQSIRELLSLGVDRFIEVGPGKVLSGLVRQIDRKTECLHAEDVKSVEEVLTSLETKEKPQAKSQKPE